ILPSRRSQRSPLERLGRACSSERRSRAPDAWRPEPLEPGQGLVLGAVTSRTGGRSRLRPHAGQPLPSHSAVSQVAHGQEAERLHVCPARSRPARRAGGDFRWRPLNFAVAGGSNRSSRSTAPLPLSTPFTRRIVIRVGGFLRRSQLFWHFSEIHSNAGPGGRPATHGVDQHVVYGEKRGHFGMLTLPSFETRACPFSLP